MVTRSHLVHGRLLRKGGVVLSAISGLLLGIIMRLIAEHTYDASQSEGFLAYIGGFILGFIIWEAARKREVRK